MAHFPQDPDVRQTYWGPDTKQKADWWFANIYPAVDETVIEKAKIVIDACMPQNQSTKDGARCYSFHMREFLLNQLLYGWHQLGYLPSGLLCFTDQLNFRPGDKKASWVHWTSRKDGRRYGQPWWYVIPTFEQACLKLGIDKQAYD